MLFTGIGDVATKSDLLDRAIPINLPRITEDQRRTEVELWHAFDAAAPAILGVLLDAVASGLANLPTTRLSRLPRMADFATWIVAASPALGWDADAFMAAYDGNRQDANAVALDALPVAAAMQTFMEDKSSWEGTATELLDALRAIATEATAKDRSWPKHTSPRSPEHIAVTSLAETSTTY